MNRIAATWAAHRTQRYHTNPRLARLGQTDADHAHGVATIIALLNPGASATLLMAALLHDAGERIAGDLSQPFKAANPQLAALHREAEEKAAVATTGMAFDLTAEETSWLKLADSLEAILFAAFHQPEVLDRADWRDFVTATRERAHLLGCGPEACAAIHGLKLGWHG